MNIEIADIFSKYRHLFPPLPKESSKVVQDIINCRTATLGGHILKCDKCGHLEQSYNSCRNRHCPKCQFVTKLKWLEKRNEELLPTNYFHLVFTLPSKFNSLILQNKRTCYNILFKAVSQTLSEVAINPKNLGAQIGFFAILHTWGQNLLDHPHLHVVVPGGGVSSDKKSWINCKENFFLPINILSLVFRGKYIDFLKKAYVKEDLEFHGKLNHLKIDGEFEKFISNSCKNNWVVYAKAPFNGPEQVLNYLGNYTHRIAISNSRIIKVEDEKVYFYYKDYADNNKKKVMILSVIEFMRRFLLHVLPKGFVKIRYFGIFSNKYRRENIELCVKLISLQINTEALDKSSSGRIDNLNDKVSKETTEELMKRVIGIDIYECPKCKKGSLIQVGEIKSFFSSA